MRKYIIDQALFIIIYMVIMICGSCVFWKVGQVFTVLFDSAIIFIVSVLCRRVLVLPLDLITGKTTKIVYYCYQTTVYDFEFFKNTHCCEWKFRYGNETLWLLIPVAMAKDEILTMKHPAKDQKIRITYYRRAKILDSWEPV